MAEAVATRLAELGVKKIRVHDASRSHLSYILADIFKFKGLVLGGPTYSNTLYPPVESVAQAIKTREIKNRIIATFGSYTWAPQAVKRLNTVLEEGKGIVKDLISVEAKQAPDVAALAECRALAEAIAAQLEE